MKKVLKQFFKGLYVLIATICTGVGSVCSFIAILDAKGFVSIGMFFLFLIYLTIFLVSIYLIGADMKEGVE